MTTSRSLALAAAVLGVVSMLVGACGDEEIIPAPTHDLAEPWQPRPFAVDPALIAAAERICRDPALPMVRAGLPLVVVDARGADRLLLLFAGADETGECFLTRDRAGRLVFDSGGGGSSNPPPPALQPTEIRFNGAGSSDNPEGPWSYGVGKAGQAIALVELTPPSGVVVQASLNRGWFAAWWLGLDHDAQIVVRGYDAGGRLVGMSP